MESLLRKLHKWIKQQLLLLDKKSKMEKKSSFAFSYFLITAVILSLLWEKPVLNNPIINTIYLILELSLLPALLSIFGNHLHQKNNAFMNRMSDTISKGKKMYEDVFTTIDENEMAEYSDGRSLDSQSPDFGSDTDDSIQNSLYTDETSPTLLPYKKSNVWPFLPAITAGFLFPAFTVKTSGSNMGLFETFISAALTALLFIIILIIEAPFVRAKHKRKFVLTQKGEKKNG